MATFAVSVTKIFIKPHSNADALELGNVGSPDGFQVVVKKGLYQSGDVIAYIGENAVVPDETLKRYGFWNEEKNIGMLAGNSGNRVKAIKLRGEFSLGIIIPMVEQDGKYRLKYDPAYLTDANVYYNIGDDVSARLGVTKYEPQIPTQMAGEVWNATGYTLKYDIENFKNFPDVLQPGEHVFITEKLHGTWCCFGYHPDVDHPIITSKGLSAKGLAFKMNEANNDNLYIRAFHGLTWLLAPNGKTLLDRARDIFGDQPIYIVGEVYGRGVQDLHYGESTPRFRAFDIYLGTPGQGHYVDSCDLMKYCESMDVDTVPVLYWGPFDKQIMLEHTNGKDFNDNHIREGIVIKPSPERRNEQIGRVVLKSISDDYLLRKNKDATEYQ